MARISFTTRRSIREDAHNYYHNTVIKPISKMTVKEQEERARNMGYVTWTDKELEDALSSLNHNIDTGQGTQLDSNIVILMTRELNSRHE